MPSQILPTGTTGPRATFIEDGCFEGCRHAVASNGGGRYVFRHNYVTGTVVSHAIDAHGAEFPSTPWTRSEPKLLSLITDASGKPLRVQILAPAAGSVPVSLSEDPVWIEQPMGSAHECHRQGQ